MVLLLLRRRVVHGRVEDGDGTARTGLHKIEAPGARRSKYDACQDRKKKTD